MNAPNGGELAANAARALERYRDQERFLEREIATLGARLEMIQGFIAALTATPRQVRKPRTNAEAALNSILPEPQPDTDVP